ncbi:MAG: HIRAN domain-containing protein [Actinomycetales bacterium]
MVWWKAKRIQLLPEQLVVTGERHHADEIRAVLSEAGSGHLQFRCTAQLRPEPQNASDPHAVAVIVGGRRVGYIAKAHSKPVAEALSGRTTEAKCVINWNGEIDNGIYRVKLFASL